LVAFVVRQLFEWSILCAMSSYVKMGINAIIRPPRARYAVEQLPATIPLVGLPDIRREAVEFRNARGQKIVGSYYVPPYRIEEPSCVLYLHGNASCQMEGIFLVSVFCPAGVAVLCFDFAGCGNSEGDYISLGMHEKDDVARAIEFVRARFHVGRVAIWGRSMGAATAFFTLADDPTIACAVADSPFASLKTLIQELAGNFHAPGFLSSMAVSYLARKIKAIANFDIKDLNPVTAAAMCFSPILIMHGVQDTFIKPEHSQKLFAAYAGEDKEFRLIDGADHNSERPLDVQVQAIMFIARALEAPVVIEEISGLVQSARYHFAGVTEMMEFTGFTDDELAQMRQIAAEH
jgi:pimeloyl-ACP methyl ester carboxylesterase